jgi:hydroxyacylglutathione hydrolase
MWNSGIVSVLYRGSLYVLGGSFRIDHELADGNSTEPDESRAGKMPVFHTPGYSKGSISLFLQREGVLFSGDAIPVTGDLPVYDDAAASVQ